jgi:hypothetical protein
MRLNAPRWLLVFEGLLLISAVIVLAYKALMWVSPLRGLDQTPHARRVDPLAQLQDYYRRYPERYIRAGGESWRIDPQSSISFHSLTLTNSATVGYEAIELRFTYSSASGKVLKRADVQIAKPIPALGSIELKGIEVKNVPAAAESVVTTVLSARVRESVH